MKEYEIPSIERVTERIRQLANEYTRQIEEKEPRQSTNTLSQPESARTIGHRRMARDEIRIERFARLHAVLYAIIEATHSGKIILPKGRLHASHLPPVNKAYLEQEYPGNTLEEKLSAALKHHLEYFPENSERLKKQGIDV